MVTKALLCLMVLLLLPESGHALQTHGAPEGLYVHQMAHFHFIIALAYLSWDIRRSAFSSPGWRYLRIFCLLMILWNSGAIIGHIFEVNLGPEQILRDGGYLQSRLAAPITRFKLIYFCAKLDHLVMVPALFFLYLAMRTMRRSVENQPPEQEGTVQ